VKRGRGIFLFLLLVTTGASAQQQESPLTKKMLEKSPATSKTASDKERRTGEEFRDNPEWLEEQRRAEEEALAAAEAEEVGDQKPEAGYVAGYRKSAGLGLSPLAPQAVSVVPGGVTPRMGAPTATSDFRFDFHGYLQGGLRAGFGTREAPLDGQKKTTIHGDPLVPGSAFGWFEHTYTVPVPWAQLNFEFGNDVVRATAILGAWSFSASDDAQGYFQPPSKLGFNDAYLTYTPKVDPVGLRINAGVFQESYGAMSEYHNGAYGTSLIGVVFGTGVTSTVSLPYENGVTVSVEAGFKGDFNRAPPELVLDQNNEFTPAIEGSTYAAHGHLSFDFDRKIELTGHGIYSFSQDDRGDELAGRELYLGNNPRRDGSLLILGADARFRLRHAGHLYLGGSRIIGEDTQTLSNLVQVLNNGAGRDLTQRYFTYSSAGNGSMWLLGGQYELSLGKLLRYPAEFYGGAPDLTVSAFGIYAKLKNEGDVLPEADLLKFGTEAFYTPFRWFGVAGRFDAVMPEMADQTKSFHVITPKLVFRNDWNNQATLTLQYSGYFLGENTTLRGDDRLINNPSQRPDAHLAAIYGTIWW
jgi:hypothetical protein